MALRAPAIANILVDIELEKRQFGKPNAAGLAMHSSKWDKY
jgi:hypothetical protein